MKLRIASAALAAAALAATSARAAEPKTKPGLREEGLRGEGLRGEMSAIPMVALGVLPSWSIGIAPAMGFRWPGLSVAIEAQVLYGLDREPVGGGASTVTGIAMAVPSVCGHSGAFFACGVLGAGELRTESDPSLNVQTKDPWLVAFGLRGGFDWFVSPHFAVRSHLTGVTLLARPSLGFEGAEIWRTAPFGAAFGLGIMVPLGVESRP